MPDTEVGTKRYADYSSSNDEANKRPKQEVLKLRLLVKGEYAGKMIGKGGENFRRLREHYSVKITGLSSRTEERVLQIEGKKEDCISVIKEVLPLCREAPFLSRSTRSSVELNILVNTSNIGILIGKGGSTLKDIRDETDGHIKVYQDCLPNSNERVVAMGGQDQSMLLTVLEKVVGILESIVSSSPTVFYDPSNTTALQMPQPNLQLQTNLQQQQQQQQQQQSYKSGYQDVAPNATDIAKLLLLARDAKQRRPPSDNDFGVVSTTTTLNVTNAMCGVIIGKGGMHIKQIRSTSGAKIDFTTLEPGIQSDRVITITGNYDQVQIASQLMAQFWSNS